MTDSCLQWEFLYQYNGVLLMNRDPMWWNKCFASRYLYLDAWVVFQSLFYVLLLIIMNETFRIMSNLKLNIVLLINQAVGMFQNKYMKLI